jgi:glycosyltransferase involved in cell wall biosynthesis
MCDWVYELLLVNEIPAAKLSRSRQGISWTLNPKPEPVSDREGADEVRFAFLGRLDSTKGLHVLINAFRMEPKLNVSLHVYGVAQSSANAAYQKEMFGLAGGDPRISFRDGIGSRDVVSVLRQYDFLAVPSQWMETGPMVVLEAFTAGIPVIGANLGGIAELVRDGADGLLVEYNSVARWAETLRQVAGDAEQRVRLKAGVRPPRTSIQVAREMFDLYQTLVGPQACRSGESPGAPPTTCARSPGSFRPS